MKNGDIVISKSSLETQNYGEQFTKVLRPQDTVFLIGDLGSGKTTFVKGLAMGLGISSRILSPTFVVVRRHTIEKEDRVNPSIHNFYHLDLYRLENEPDVKNVDVKEFLEDKNGIVAIEWPQIGQALVNKKVWKIQFEYAGEDMRRIGLKYE